MILPQPVANVLALHSEYGKLAGNFVEKIASQLQMDPAGIAIPTARPLSNQEGQPLTYFDVWSTDIVLAYVAPNPSLNTTTFAAALRWRGRESKGGPPGVQMWQSEDTEAHISTVFGRYWQDERVLQPELGFEIVTGV